MGEPTKLPEIPDDDADFTPGLARKIIAKYQAIISMRNSDNAALVNALEDIAAMDPKGVRADDLGRAARTASEVLSRVVGGAR